MYQSSKPRGYLAELLQAPLRGAILVPCPSGLSPFFPNTGSGDVRLERLFPPPMYSSQRQAREARVQRVQTHALRAETSPGRRVPRRTADAHRLN